MTCLRCRAENSAGRCFCGECGAPLAMLCGSCEFSNEPGIKAPLGVTPATAAAARFTSPDAYTPKHLAEKILISKSALEGRLRS